MTWLEMSARWHSARLGAYRYFVPTRNQMIMFAVSIAIHVAFNLLDALVRWI